MKLYESFKCKCGVAAGLAYEEHLREALVRGQLGMRCTRCGRDMQRWYEPGPGVRYLMRLGRPNGAIGQSIFGEALPDPVKRGDFLSARSAARELGVSPKKIERMFRDGEIPGARQDGGKGHTILIPKNWVVEQKVMQERAAALERDEAA